MPPDAATPAPADHDSWATLRRFLPYLWPEDRADLKWRIGIALVLVLIAKAIVLATPLAMKRVVDTMAADGASMDWTTRETRAAVVHRRRFRS